MRVAGKEGSEKSALHEKTKKCIRGEIASDVYFVV
jgi:hypothetical protein